MSVTARGSSLRAFSIEQDTVAEKWIERNLEPTPSATDAFVAVNSTGFSSSKWLVTL